ncbi:MAG TPA: ATP synthase F1 subunit epsilon [Candidatus Nanoarchaeia archaeon]|nr:ATP synthase epsilon chain [uncultured archaeon]
MLLEIITPEKKVYSGEADQVSLPTSEGEITVLPNHLPLVTEINPGEITIKAAGKIHHLVTGKGFAEVTAKTVSVLTNLAESGGELDEKRIEEAKKRAEEALKEKHLMSEEEYAATAAALEQSLARLRFVRKHHTRGRISTEQEA